MINRAYSITCACENRILPVPVPGVTFSSGTVLCINTFLHDRRKLKRLIISKGIIQNGLNMAAVYGCWLSLFISQLVYFTHLSRDNLPLT
jgi:hypothetical protein